VIGQAKGILMEQRSVGPDEAFHLLRLASQRLNVKLRDIAAQVVSHRRLPEA
jgi:AmiR/NasT family two-component response regulator